MSKYVCGIDIGTTGVKVMILYGQELQFPVIIRVSSTFPQTAG